MSKAPSAPPQYIGTKDRNLSPSPKSQIWSSTLFPSNSTFLVKLKEKFKNL